MQLRLNISKRELAIWCGSWTAAIALLVCGWMMFWTAEGGHPTETPIAARDGWSPDAAAAAAPIVAAMPDFEITDGEGRLIVQANETANVRLWHAPLELFGHHLPNEPQLRGDCVSHAAKHAAEYLICIELKTGPPTLDLEYHPIAAHFLYGTSRVLVGRVGRGGPIKPSQDGACGAWAAEAVTQYGLLRADLPGVPPYGAQIAGEWGREGPPQRWLDEARPFRIKTTSPVRSADAVRDAICNGYPVTIASNVGFGPTNRYRHRVQDGRLVGLESGEWHHAMCVLGYDGATGREPYFYILNSWGPDAMGKPLGDEPPGGFWVTADTMDRIARQGDSFAYSSFEGFRSRELINFFGAARDAGCGHVVRRGATLDGSRGLKPTATFNGRSATKPSRQGCQSCSHDSSNSSA